jgi:DNA-binding Lrp family transcriptional regulator
MKLKLSENESGVLRCLLEDGRMQCTDIAKRLGITSQAAGKIKDRLESRGIIKGYSAEVDYEKMGISFFAIAFYTFKPDIREDLERNLIIERVRGPHLIRVYRVSEGECTHIVVYGFRSYREVEHYFELVQKEKGHISELKRLHVLSAENVLKDSPRELFLKLIDEKDDEKLARPELPRAISYIDLV